MSDDKLIVISASELLAIEIALDELTSYLDVVGNEGDLGDDDMPSGKLYWTKAKLETLLLRFPEQLDWAKARRTSK